MIRKTLPILLALALFSYIVGLLNHPFVFIISFAGFSYVMLFMFGLVSWRVLPGRVRTNIWEHKLLFVLSVAGWLILFLLGRGVINKYYMPRALDAIRISAKVLLLIISLLLGWLTINRVRKRTVAACAFVYILFIVLAPVVTSTDTRAGDDEAGAAGESQLIRLGDLSSLPYVDWTPETNPEKVGVTKYDPQYCFDGINIFNSKTLAQAYLVDMEGKVLHTWRDSDRSHQWHEEVQLCRNGDLLAIVKDEMLIRFDWDSNIKWTNKMRCHHEITLDANGDMYVLARRDDMAFVGGFPVPILNDYIAFVSSDGRTKREIPLLKAVRGHIPFRVVPKIYWWIIKPKNLMSVIRDMRTKSFVCRHGSAFDIFHNNTITIIDREIEGVCKKGSLLVCNRELDLIGILDIAKEEFVWSWGPGELSRPHHPTLLENGNILIFDNGRIKGYSRIIELDPVTKQIVWEYKASPPEEFYTPIRGSCQRLPNGNTLITESNKGRVFEVTRDGEIVWEFFNWEVDPEKKKRAVIYRMMRITDPENYSNLSTLY